MLNFFCRKINVEAATPTFIIEPSISNQWYTREMKFTFAELYPLLVQKKENFIDRGEKLRGEIKDLDDFQLIRDNFSIVCA